MKALSRGKQPARETRHTLCNFTVPTLIATMLLRKIIPLALLPLVSFADTENLRLNDRSALPSYEKMMAASSDDIARIDEAATVAAATTPTTQQTHDVYVEIRTDGQLGDGSKDNPYDGGTQAHFDGVLNTMMNASRSVAITLHLAAGVYIVTPIPQIPTATNSAGYTSNVPGNISILGAGETKTTVRAGIASTPNTYYWVLAQVGNTGGTSYENMTIDCNMQNQTSNVTINGIDFVNFYGLPTQASAKHIHVINGGNAPGFQGYAEWTAIAIRDFSPTGVTSISHCLVDHYQGMAACTAIAANTYITDNVVVLNGADPFNLTGKGGTGGYQNAYSYAHNVDNNVCRNCTEGLYSDTDSVDGVKVENNWFEALYQGICIYNNNPAATVNNVTITNNVISRVYDRAIVLGNAAGTLVNGGFTINRNFLNTKDVPGAGRVDSCVAIISSQDCVITNNVVTTSRRGNFAPPAAGVFASSDVSTFTWANNRYRTGQVIPPPSGVNSN